MMLTTGANAYLPRSGSPDRCDAVVVFAASLAEARAAVAGSEVGLRIYGPGSAVRSDLRDDVIDAATFATHSVLNRHEAAMLARRAEPLDAARSLSESVRIDVVVTDGPNGCLAANADGLTRTQAGFEVRACDTTEAGDCFTAGLAAGFIGGSGADAAMEYACAAAALSTTEHGTASGPTRERVEAFLLAHRRKAR